MRKIILILAVMVLPAGIAFAGAGTTGAEFLKINVGGRASAFSGAYSAVSGDVFTGQYNPAGLSRMENRELAFMHNEWLMGTRYEFLGFAMPTANGGISIGIRYFDLGSFTGRNALGQPNGDFSATDQSYNIAYGRVLNNVLSVGISCAYIRQRIASSKSDGFAIDLGVDIEAISDRLTFALCSKNLGPKMSNFDREGMDLPLSNSIGFLFSPNKLMITGDVIMPKGRDSYLALGCEYGLFDMIDLRSGLSLGSEREDEFSWTAGMGIKIMDYSLDYCFEPVGDLDFGQRLSVSMKF